MDRVEVSRSEGKDPLRSVCVFCGSNPGRSRVHADQARLLGRTLAERGTILVYGAGGTGLMGVLADAALAAGGRVIGIIPHWLARAELLHPGPIEKHVVDSMHQRKALMSRLADGFIALPGGFGTLEELLEVITWAQLEIQVKPIGILDADGYYEPFLAMVERAMAEGFIRRELGSLFVVEREVPALLERLDSRPVRQDGVDLRRV